MKKSLITGATGFLGNSLLKKLNNIGHETVPLNSKNADLTDSSSLDKFNSLNLNYIFHLATWTQAGDFCVYHPAEQWCINQQINTNVLNWWSKYQPQAKLISIGTSCSYEETSIHKEDNYLLGVPREELYTYAMTKRMLLIGQKALEKQFGLKYLTFIPSTLYGPYYNIKKKQLHFIFDIIRKIIAYKKDKEEIILWGDGTQKRELVFVEDFVNIMMILLDRVENDIVNIGAGSDYSISEFAQMVCDIIGVNYNNIKFNTSRYVGAKSKILDNSKLNNLVSDYSQIPIKKGLKLTIDWIKNGQI